MNHTVALVATTALAVSTYLLLLRPLLARRLLTTELRMVCDDLATDLREGLVPPGHTVVEDLGAFVATALANPDAALDEVRSFLDGDWAEFLIGDHQTRLHPQPDLSARAIDLLSGYWELIGFSMGRYRDEGSVLGALRRWRRSRHLGPNLASFPQPWQQPRHPENTPLPQPGLQLWTDRRRSAPAPDFTACSAMPATLPERPTVPIPRIRRPHRQAPGPTAPVAPNAPAVANVSLMTAERPD
jgi:hypothetical protein